MPALNFTLESKIAWILERQEGQTIRPVGKRIFRPRDKLYLYAHQRTKNCRKLGEAVCSEVVPVKFYCRCKMLAIIEGNPCPGYQQFAVADGFKTWCELEQFFVTTYKLQTDDFLDMVIIKWRDFKPEAKP